MSKHDQKDLDRIGFTDPASGKGRVKKVRARQAIIVIAADSLRRIFVLFAWAGRLPTSKYIDKIIKTCDNFQPRVFGIEANAMQSLFADAVMMESERQMKRLPFLSVHQTTKVEKDFRIRSAIEPVINDGRLFRQTRQIDLESELRGFPTALTKDLVDCLASAIALVPPRTQQVQRSREADSLARYLRSTGAPASQIESRVRQLLEGQH